MAVPAEKKNPKGISNQQGLSLFSPRANAMTCENIFCFIFEIKSNFLL
jgi:hypothetical protein